MEVCRPLASLGPPGPDALHGVCDPWKACRILPMHALEQVTGASLESSMFPFTDLAGCYGWAPGAAAAAPVAAAGCGSMWPSPVSK